MNQILFGAALPFLIAAAIYLRRGCRASIGLLLFTPAWMALSALWAIAPDLPRLAGRYQLYERLARDPRTDIFLFHYTIDKLELDSPAYHSWIFVLFVLMLAAAWRELRIREEGA